MHISLEKKIRIKMKKYSKALSIRPARIERKMAIRINTEKIMTDSGSQLGQTSEGPAASDPETRHSLRAVKDVCVAHVIHYTTNRPLMILPLE